MAVGNTAPVTAASRDGLNEAALGFAKYPDKTFIGRSAKGFEFLGYRLGPQGLTVAKQTRERSAARAPRLQEHERGGARAGVELI
jgi:hypothetical protein